MKATVITILSVFLISSKCNNKTTSTSMEKNDRIQKVVNRDNRGRITKTYDGFIYRIFDSLGRQIEWYGNYNNPESHSNTRKIVEYSDTLITAREYVFEDDNKGCQITNSLDCSLTKYYYKDGELYKREDYLRIESPKDGKVIGHNLIYTDLAPKQNPYIFYLPKYLR